MALTDILCKSAQPGQKPRKIADSGGLYLEVMPNGSKYWRLKYRHLGKEKRLAVGVYPQVSLKEARNKRDDAKRMIAEGTDPGQRKKEQKRTAMLNAENTFEAIAREWHENQKATWSERHAEAVLRRLEVDLFPTLGGRPVADIDAPELLSTLRTIEGRGAIDIAKRARQKCGQIIRYAVVTGRAQRDITADLKGALKTRQQKHYNHLEAADLPALLGKIATYDGDLQTKLALQFALLTFVRTGELRGARWDEINFDTAEWRIPAERMKMKQKHIVPLSKQALAILKELQAMNGNRDHVFPNRNKPTSIISENTMLYALYRMGYHSRITVHGFRGTASTILNEHGFNADVIERQLAHKETNEVRAAYNHAQHLPERKKMMQWWADCLEAAASGKAPDTSNVVEMKKRKRG